MPNTRAAALPIGREQRTVTDARATYLHHRTEPCRRPQTTHLSSTPTRPTPMLALSHGLVSTHVHHATDWPVGASQMSRNWRSSAGHSCGRARPRTAAPTALTLAEAPAPAMLTPREHSQATKSCRSSLQMAGASGGGTRGAQTMERPHYCPAARTLPPIARADCGSIAATAPSSFPASMKGGTSTCGSTPPDSRNAHPRSKGDSSEREGSGVGAAGVQVCCSFTRHHCPCLVTRPRRLVLPHAVSYLSILQDRGDSGDNAATVRKASRRYHLRPLRPWWWS